MKIHEFLSSHRDEIGRACARNMAHMACTPSEGEFDRHIAVFIEQVIRRLRGADGQHDGAPVPGLRETAESVGHETQRKGLTIESAARTFASLSVALGEVGGNYHVAFDAGEYKTFNETIDDGVVIAIEQFMKDADAAHQLATRERVGFLAHELRNAITSASLAFSALERSQPPMTERTQQIVRRSLRRIAKLVEDTLIELRLREATPASLGPLCVSAILSDIEADCVLEREIRVVADVADSLMAIADEQLLTMAVSNLIKNAITYSRDGGLVQLRARGDGDTILVEVEDECGGLPEDAIKDLFKPFVRLHADDRGFGLGLAIARRAADALSAAIGVRNLPGKGCVFALRLRSASSAVDGADGLRRESAGAGGAAATRS